jgi:hypothetical protein
MEIHLVQVLLGGGRRLFDSLGPDHIELELARQLEARDVTRISDTEYVTVWRARRGIQKRRTDRRFLHEIDRG